MSEWPRRKTQSESMRRYSLDLETGLLEVELTDGVRLRDKAEDAMLLEAMTAKRVTVDLLERELTIVMLDGTVADFELGSPETQHSTSQNRPVVYLDQLHWITLAKQIRSPNRVPERDREAAAKLIQLVRERRVILAFASAHLLEAPVSGRQRRDFATTVLALSGGWQMRGPIDVRQQELIAAIGGGVSRAVGVFTLQPDVLFSEPPRAWDAPRDFSQELQDIHHRLTSISALYESMVDETPIDKAPGRVAAAKWAASFQQLADYLQGRTASRADTRGAALAAMASDLRQEVVNAAQGAGVAPGAFGDWIANEWETALANMPYLGRLLEVAYERLRNSEDKWEPNDLVDMHYLCCAAAYADIVVGERKTSELLMRANARLAPAAFVCPTIPRAVERLNAIIADDLRRAD